ncbi:hypothetical protein, partial [Streptosporangium roseum]|uniref:hypothetical protein n=1 Tax=Streptosporangium roseum TaxID=2001 RepID=UPI0031EA29D2
GLPTPDLYGDTAPGKQIVETRKKFATVPVEHFAPMLSSAWPRFAFSLMHGRKGAPPEACGSPVFSLPAEPDRPAHRRTPP